MAYTLKTFADIFTAAREELKIQASDSNSLNRIKRDINIVYKEVIGEHKWWWLSSSADLQVQPYVAAGTANVSQNSATVVLTDAPTSSKRGFKFSVDGFQEIYTIDSHTAGSTTIKLDGVFTGPTNTTATYKIWTDRVALPLDCKETTTVYQDYDNQPMETAGLQEFRRIASATPKAEGKPRFYCTGDFKDPKETSTSSIPAVVTRSSSGSTKTLVFASTLPSTIAVGTKLKVSRVGEPSYAGEIYVGTIESSSTTNDTITYTGRSPLDESATSDMSISVEIIGPTAINTRYRELLIHPALNQARLTLHIDYLKEVLDLENDGDEPLLPVDDRVVLLYGALHRAWARERNPEEATRNYTLYTNKLAKMAGKLQDTFDSPKLQVSRNYLRAKRSTPRGASLGFGGSNIGIGGSGGASAPTGAANTAAQFNSSGVLSSSPVTSTELGRLSGVTSNVQAQIDALSSGFISTMVGDVTSPGGGTATTTVVTVGGSTAADVHSAELLANAATDANTASAIVKRDASGNFSATTISADLTGNVTGNVVGNLTGNVSGSAATITGSLTGDVTSTGMATTVATVGGSSAANIHTAEQLANAATNANTASAIVKRDGSGNFSAGTITATLSGTASNLDSLAAGGTVSVGATNATTINIGTPGATVNIQGAVNNISATNLDVSDQLVTLNHGGSAGSGAGTGIEVEEGGSITGYAKVSPDRNSWNLKAPNTAGVVSITPGASNDTVATLAATQTLTNKTMGDALKFTAIATPSAPGSGRYLYPKSDGKFYHMGSDGVETAVGSGSGGGGLNLLTLGSTYVVDNQTDADAETSVGRWTVYADAAGILPVDMAGGSPGSTLTRTTSSPLNGSASFLMDLGASGSSRQGEGVVLGPVYVPPGYRGRTVMLSSVFAVTGSIVDGDIVPYAYDITNSALITPYQVGKVLGASGKQVCKFDIPSTCAQLRVGYHVARTATTSLSVKFDDFKLTDEVVPNGLAGSNWTDYTPTGSWTANTTYAGKWRRVGDSMEVQVQVSCSGAPTAAGLAVSLPTGYAIDTNKILVNADTRGSLLSQGEVRDGGTATYWVQARYAGSTTSVTISTVRADGTFGVGNDVSNTTPITFGATDNVTVTFLVPIAGWDANITMASSAKISLASILANGTRVTGSAPTALGQYRSYLRNANAETYTETNGTPTALPSVADGIKLYCSGTRAAADASGQPSKYEFFVGKNLPPENISIPFWKSAGKIGALDVTPFATSSTDFGVLGATKPLYDPQTGILTVMQNELGDTNNRIGIDASGANVTSAFFDVIIMQSALAVGIEATPSLRYESLAGTQTVANTVTNAVLNYETKKYDTHSAVTTGSSWTWACQQAGKYRIAATLFTITSGTSSYIQIRAFKNTTQIGQDENFNAAARKHLSLETEDNFVVGDTLQIQISNQSGATITIRGGAGENYITITKVSN